MQRNLIFKVSSHNDLTTHDHISPHKKFVYTSPIFSFSSYDTEALNKSCNELYSDIEFENRFQHTQHKKINTGIQQLYIIGLYDALPVQELLDIFGTYLPPPLFLTLKRYVTPNEPDRRRDRPITIHWPRFRSAIDRLNDGSKQNINRDLITLLSTHTPSEKHVKTFHIFKNQKTNQSTEPNQTNTTQMISNFLASIYQRNILASLIKYTFLHTLLKTLDTSAVLTQRRGIFFMIHQRLQEIIFECALTSFNGSNYDNYLLCNSLILIQSRLKEKIFLFKKGASISSILCVNRTNFNCRKAEEEEEEEEEEKKEKNRNKKEKRPQPSRKDPKRENKEKTKRKINNNKWTMKLYIKDIRNLVAANMTLDRIGKLFNLPVSKLVFPYNQATSIRKIKNISSMQPNNDLFWKDSFFGKTPSLESRIEAESIFKEKKFENLYDFGTYYLIQDCALLHSILLTLFKSFLEQDPSVNIFLRRNYSQSSLSYQQFFIIEPSKQIEKQLAPRVINNSVYNYMIKSAVTGGLCTSFVHGKMNESITINEHFNYLKKPKLNTVSWPNFLHCGKWEKQFNEKPSGITTLDIRSLYPSAAVKKIPVGTPLFYSRFTLDDHDKLFFTDPFVRSLKLNKYCTNVNQAGNHQTDRFQLLNLPPRFQTEFSALAHYLHPFQTDPNIRILRFQSAFTALGQLTFSTFPIDGFLSYKELTSETIHIKLIQYQSLFFHGHASNCPVPNNEKESESSKKTQLVTHEIKQLCSHYRNHFKNHLHRNTTIEYVEISDCDFPDHHLPHDTKYLMSYNKSYTYQSFLRNIFNKKLTGLVVVKNLKIKKTNQNPIFGFIIQKIEYGIKNLSPYTQEQVTRFETATRVLSVHENKSFMVMSTEYFNFLHNTFGFEGTPDIYHALFFQLDDYLRSSIENKLMLRKELKNLIKQEKNPETRQNYEVKAELIKLMLNSCYGYTLCNISSQKFKQFENRRTKPSSTNGSIRSCLQLEKNVFLIEKTKKHEESFPTLLGHVGCYILFNSKVILLKRLYFLLKFLNPKLAQLLYMDTDSAHFLVKHKALEENVSPGLKYFFKRQFDKHFETGNKMSGIWVEEGFYECGEYLAEKCYRLYNKTSDIYLTHMKGLNSSFQKEYHTHGIDPRKTPFLAYNQFFKSPDFLIFKTHMCKNIFSNYVPNKRYFVSATGSLPLKFS